MRKLGFSLMELLISVAIVGILSAIALVSYRSFTYKANRSEAISTLLAMQLAEEKYRSNNSNYGTLAQVWNSVTTTPNGLYNLSITNVSGTSYTLTATATGTQVNDVESGTSCTPLVITVSAGVENRTPSICFTR